MAKNIPIGIDNFFELVNPANNYLYADKTLMIDKVLKDKSKLTLIIRPRRWGKTLNMSMLQYFLAATVNRKSTKNLFNHLAIAQIKDEIDGQFIIDKYQGKYPVIFVTFKDIKENTFSKTIEKLKGLIEDIYSEHEYLLKSEFLLEHDKDLFKKYLTGSVTEVELERSIKVLSKFLAKHHNQSVYILIDEYDTPLNFIYSEVSDPSYIKDISIFIRNFFSESFKGNNDLQKGFITGILRVAKENIFSGLNNVNEHTLLDSAYSEYYGFTEDEVNQLFKDADLEHNQNKIKEWYNGYFSGDILVYNPWSIMRCLEEKGRIEPYWINTANNELIKKALLSAEVNVKEKIEQLMQGKTVSGNIDKYISFNQLEQNETALWSLLLFSGYLKTITAKLDKNTGIFICQLAIPNGEVLSLYSRYFKELLEQQLGKDYESFIKYLITGDIEHFTHLLNKYLIESISTYDFTHYPEAFYHGLVLGLIASLRDSHLVYSNRESGLGRYDVMLIPQKNYNSLPGIILEFKHAKINQNIEQLAEQALTQINEKQYDAELKKHCYVKKMIQIGLAFSEKSVVSRYITRDLIL